MGQLPFFRLRRRKNLEEIKEARARWEFAFYRWRNLLLLTALSVQTAEVVIAAIEGRRPDLLLPIPFLEHATARSP